MRSKIQKERCKSCVPRSPSHDVDRKLAKPREISDAGTNPNTLTEKDAAILMDFAPYVLFSSLLPLRVVLMLFRIVEDRR